MEGEPILARLLFHDDRHSSFKWFGGEQVRARRHASPMGVNLSSEMVLFVKLPDSLMRKNNDRPKL